MAAAASTTVNSTFNITETIMQYWDPIPESLTVESGDQQSPVETAVKVVSASAAIPHHRAYIADKVVWAFREVEVIKIRAAEAMQRTIAKGIFKGIMNDVASSNGAIRGWLEGDAKMRKMTGFEGKGYDHIGNTRGRILAGSTHLDPSKSIVVVCGAQFFGKEIVEPLKELQGRCKLLVVVDFDQTTLDNLAKHLDPTKLKTVQKDLTGGFVQALSEFQAELFAKKYNNVDLVPRVDEFYCNILQTHAQQRIEITEILSKEQGQADYVVSSLVASTLGYYVATNLNAFITNKLKVNIDSCFGNKNFPMAVEAFASQTDVCKALAWKHMEELFAWTAPSGHLYFADTVSANRESGKQLVMIDDELLGCMQSMAAESTTKRWVWIQSGAQHYNVWSILMTKLNK